MITHKSLTNRRRRFVELRKTQYKLKSLKRARFSEKIWQLKTNNELRIIKMLEEAKGFLECSYKEYNGTEGKEERAKNNMLKAIDLMIRDCKRCESHSKTIPTSTIRAFSSATTKLRRKSRYSDLNWECDHFWQQLGLCYHSIFA